MASKKISQTQSKIKITNTAVRNVGNVVFYVDTLQSQNIENQAWLPNGYQVRIKHYNNNKPFPFDHVPSNEELAKLWRWR